MDWRKMPSTHNSVGLGGSIGRSVAAGEVGFGAGHSLSGVSSSLCSDFVTTKRGTIDTLDFTG